MGLMQVGKAWDLIKTSQIKPVEFTSSAPVKTVLDLLRPEHQ